MNAESSINAQLLAELYSGVSPFSTHRPESVDNGYPHTHLLPEIVDLLLDVIAPRFWLEAGSMLGGSAILAAERIRARGMDTGIVCVDPFTGDVNMWAWERELTEDNKWRFLGLEGGRPSIYDRFLANVAASGTSDIILPIPATAIVGFNLLRRLKVKDRISQLPQVIYLDSAHEPGETLLELQRAWTLLEPGGVLFGDDWGWKAVRQDVLQFAFSIKPNEATLARLTERHPEFENTEGVLNWKGQWLLAK